MIGRAKNRSSVDRRVALLTGTRVGSFEIVAKIGAGGMGEVYRATDTNLKRQVALKILPAAVAEDPERLVRFQREGEALAAVNHPNIAQIYGLERSAGVTALVLELVEGPTLADRIAQQTIPVDEALSIARQIAQALHAAHERGIIHRDLKPTNVKVREDSTVKVLDFGLAKMRDPDGPQAVASDEPTLTSPVATRAGTILGTAAYMAPEQAVGRLADRRADIWAFGVVLYEMLTGRRPFEGGTVNDVISEVLKSEPDWRRLPPETPLRIRRLLKRCLRKDRADRQHDMADARIEIEQPDDEPDADAVSGFRGSRARERWLLGSLLTVVTIFAVIQSARVWQQSSAVPLAPEMRLDISTPGAPGTAFADWSDLQRVAWAAVSPNGFHVVYSMFSDGALRLWLRSLDSTTVRALPGTESAVLPFWSADSRSVAFFADSQLKRVDIDGGTLRTLAEAPFGAGGAWNADGTILFTPLFSGPIYRVSATGGEATAVTELASGDRVHQYPHFLPDGRHFLYVAAGKGGVRGIHVGALDGSSSRRLVDGELAVLHPPSGHLFFLRQGTLFSQPFDLGALALRETSAPFAEQVEVVSASPAGPLLYRQAPNQGRWQLAWLDRSGRQMGRIGAPLGDASIETELSPDGRHAALSRRLNGNLDIWWLDTVRGVLSRFTSDTAAESTLRWSPDAQRVVFASMKRGVYDLYSRSASDRDAEQMLLSSPDNKSVSDWSSDGRFLLFRSVDPVTGHDLWALPLDQPATAFPVVRTKFTEGFGQFSPDGRWIAYQSNESGRYEVYAQPFPGPGTQVPISTAGGSQPRWGPDGRELFYLGLDRRLMAVPIRPTADGKGLEVGAPQPLFTAPVAEPVPLQSGYVLAYDVSPDGQRFLVNTVTEEPSLAPITLVLNWKP